VVGAVTGSTGSAGGSAVSVAGGPAGGIDAVVGASGGTVVADAGVIHWGAWIAGAEAAGAPNGVGSIDTTIAATTAATSGRCQSPFTDWRAVRDWW
jgi:hypothetical protein